jgi:cytochrome b6-f complex iron-sulfur subunit
MSESKQTRREFCAQACHGVALAAVGAGLGGVLQGCGGSGTSGGGSGSPLPVVSASQNGGVVTLTIDAASPLAAVGSAALVQSSGGSLLVAHTGQDTFVAVSSQCTHQACTITQFASQTYICPCHGSQFTTSGQVTSGPASRPLTQFQTQFSSGVLTIS